MLLESYVIKKIAPDGKEPNAEDDSPLYKRERLKLDLFVRLAWLLKFLDCILVFILSIGNNPISTKTPASPPAIKET